MIYNFPKIRERLLHSSKVDLAQTGAYRIETRNLKPVPDVLRPFHLHSRAYVWVSSVTHHVSTYHARRSTHFMVTRSTPSRFGCNDWPFNATIY